MSTPAKPPVPTKPLRILVVEDEVLIRMLFEEMLAELGHTVDGSVGRIDEALELAKQLPCDFAILDVHINGVEVYPVAEALDARGIPFAFATGYAGAEIPEKYRGRPSMQKPFQAERLHEILREIFGA
jgi:CheY-like chemotaxis protein